MGVFFCNNIWDLQILEVAKAMNFRSAELTFQLMPIAIVINITTLVLNTFTRK